MLLLFNITIRGVLVRDQILVLILALFITKAPDGEFRAKRVTLFLLFLAKLLLS